MDGCISELPLFALGRVPVAVDFLFWTMTAQGKIQASVEHSMSGSSSRNGRIALALPFHTFPSPVRIGLDPLLVRRRRLALAYHVPIHLERLVKLLPAVRQALEARLVRLEISPAGAPKVEKFCAWGGE